jgi:hypothetical protein
MRCRDDGRIEINNSAAQRALHSIAMGHRNYLFAGAGSSGGLDAGTADVSASCAKVGLNSLDNV